MAQSINLNLIPKGIADVVNVSQYDVGRQIQFTLYDGANKYTIDPTATVQIGGRKGDNHIFIYDQTDGYVSFSGSTVTITTSQQMTAYPGDVLCQLRIIKDGNTLASLNFKMLVQERPDADGDISDTEIPALIALAEEQELDAEAWAKGTKNGIPVGSGDIQYNDHAKYWAEQAEAAAQSFADGIRYKGAITFATIPTSGMENGWEYNVTDAFTTDSRFSEGSGIYCEAGTNIIWSEDAGKWDIAGGLGGVQSFNGRHGNITPAANDYSYSQISGTPTLGTAAAKNVPASGDASTTEVVMGDDSRLTNARNAADVYSWAKAATKPSYDYSEINNTPTIPTAYTSAPEMDGTASAGSSTAWAKGDHVHPSDTSKADVSIIAEEFDATAVYAVDDYVMYNGGFYKCTTAHTGAWDANDFTQKLVSDEFGSGGGGIADLSAIAPAFSESTSYTVGTRVTYEGKLYRCTTNHSAGAWNSAHFTETNVDTDFMAKGRDYVTAGQASGSTLGTKATAEGYNNTVSGNYGHASGSNNSVTHNNAFAEGNYTQTGTANQHVMGTNNVGKTYTAFEIGNSLSVYNKVNCFEIDWDGSTKALGGIFSIKESSNILSISDSGTCASVTLAIASDGAVTLTYASTTRTATLASGHTGCFMYIGKTNKAYYVAKGQTKTISFATARTIINVDSVKASVLGDEVSDIAGNTLSEKFDATSYVDRYERYTISSSGWSSSTDANGYYTYTFTTSAYNTYKGVEITCTGSADGVEVTSAQKAAFNLLNKFWMADGTGVTSATLYAKTKPTTTFYVMLKGNYAAKNAASSTKALDITTGCDLTIQASCTFGSSMTDYSKEFDGSTERKLRFITLAVYIDPDYWSSVVDSNGYYKWMNQLNLHFTVYKRPEVSLIGASGGYSSMADLPTASEQAAYNLVDYFACSEDLTANTILQAYAKTKPTTGFYVCIEGLDMS